MDSWQWCWPSVIIAGRGTSRLLTVLGLYWMVGGLITLRFALVIRPRRGTRLALAAGMAAVVGTVLVLLRDQLDDLLAAACCLASGSLLLLEGVRLRRFARTVRAGIDHGVLD